MKAGARLLSVLLIMTLCFGMTNAEAFAASHTEILLDELVQDHAEGGDEEESPTPEGQSQKQTGVPSNEAEYLVEDPETEPALPSSEPKLDEQEDQDAPEAGIEEKDKDENKGEEKTEDKNEEKNDANDTDLAAASETTTKAVRYGADQEAVSYDTLSDALAAAEDGDRIVLVKNVSVTGPVVIRRDLELDLGGKTLRVNAPAEVADCAVLVTEGASVRLENGSLIVDSGVNETGEPVGYRVGILTSEGASVVLDGLNLDYRFPDGSMLATGEGDGAGRIRITGEGKYSGDPSAFLDEEYQADGSAEGAYIIRKIQQRQKMGLMKAPAATDVARIGENGYATLAEAMQVELGEDEEIVLLKDGGSILADMVTRDTVINLNGHALEAVTVPEGKTLGLYNGSTGDISSRGGLVLSGLTTGSIEASAGTAGNGVLAIVTDEGAVTADAIRITTSSAASPQMLVSIPAGSFGSLALDGDGTNLSKTDLGTGLPVGISGGSFASPVPAVLAASGYSPTVQRSDGTYSVGRTPSLEEENKKTYVQYYKDKDDKAKNKDMTFTSDGTVKSVSVTGGELPGVTVSGTRTTIAAGDDRNGNLFKALPAGKNQLTFTFSNDVQKQFPLYVWPDVEFDTVRHAKESGKPIVIQLSDKPDGVSLGKTETAKDHSSLLTPGTDVLIEDNKVTLPAASLDKLDLGTWYVGLHYGGGTILYAITIAPAPTITPKQSDWGVGSGSKSFTVTPVQVDGKNAITGVSLGTTALKAGQYTVDDKGVVTLKEAVIADLGLTTGASYPLTVTTVDGPVTAVLTLVPTLRVKGSNSHTSGGSKNLVFLSSDPVSELWIGSTKLTGNQYSLSEDKKTITLKAEFLNWLPLDTYKLTAIVVIGQQTFKPDAAFKVISPSAAAVSPRTGDPNDPHIWAALMILAGAGLVILVPKRRKRD